MSLLELRGLRSHLAGPFDLTVAAGECVAITGPSGAGKSLFLRMVADLDPNEGEVLLRGKPRSGFPPPQWRQQVSYSAAEPGWWAPAVGMHFPAAARDRVAALMSLLDLRGELFIAPVTQLSTGERQRMALIRALIAGPAVLLLDEPTGALDQESTALVEELLFDQLDAGTAILIVTHNEAQARRVGTRCLRIEQRRFATR